MRAADLPWQAWAIGAAALAFVAWRAGRPDGESLGTSLGLGAASTATDAAAGVAVGIGDALGLPRVSETECQRARREGRYTAATFYCSAPDTIAYTWRRLWGGAGVAD